MLGSLYSSLTGLDAFSKGLNVLSNNIANLNTPGFKGNSLNFSDLFYRSTLSANGENQTEIGQGVATDLTSIDFSQGNLQTTGNPLDVAITGNGLLVLQSGNQTYYTRAGQLQISPDGLLVDQVTGDAVQALNSSGQLSDINISALKTNPPNPTTTVTLTGNLTTDLGTTGTATDQINNVTVYDAAGAAHTLQLQLSSTSPGVWTVNVLEPSVSTTAVIGTGTIKYQGNGSPQAGANTVTFTLSPPGTNSSQIVLDFGAPGSFSGTTGFSSGTTSSAQVASQDGYGLGAITTTTFDQNGNLVISYSNGQKVNGPQLALAWFENPQALSQEGQSLFANNSKQTPVLAHANEGVMGSITAGSIELSNVQLTDQFTQMIIIQRGYEAASEVTTTVNEMIQQLLNIQSQKG